MKRVSPDSFSSQSDYEDLPGLFISLNKVLEENRLYYSGVGSGGNKAVEFARCYGELLEMTEKTLKLLLPVAALCPFFDYAPNIKGNGYRTIVRVVELCFRRLHALGNYFQEKRNGFLFRTDHYYKEILSYLELSKGLYKFLEFAQLLLKWNSANESNDLFPPEDNCDAIKMTEVHLQEMEKECFYGRRLGFHFNTALRSFLTTVSITMASFGDGFSKHDGSFTVAAASLLNGPKYLINPDLRAKKIISLTTCVDMEFCKAFWSLTEKYGFQHVPYVISSALSVSIMFQIPPEPLEVISKSGETIILDPPSSWVGLAPVNAHLLSYMLREGQSSLNGKKQDTTDKPKGEPKSTGLIIHMHGGGFVAQSSTSHEIYLRGWAKSINVPILSINYALAPELPFPRALEECLFAYVWALKNLEKLGTTGENIALVGDSAGGNLAITLCLKAVASGIRLPNGILTAYAPFNVQFLPSPSRLLCMMDPLLPVGILTQCLGAYTGASRNANTPVQEEHAENSQPTTSHTYVPYTCLKKEDTETTCAENKSPGNSFTGPHEFNTPDVCEHSGLVSSDDIGVDVLPDIAHGNRCKIVLQHSSSDFDLLHSDTAAPAMTRSHSDSDLLDGSQEAVEKHPVNKIPCGILTDDYMMSMAKNPYLSPLAASDEQLASLPPVDLLACSMDPLFDDSIEFAKRLRAVGNKVELYVVDDLPHGFLSFYMVCQEGREANELCISCIKKILFGKRNVVAAEVSPVY